MGPHILLLVWLYTVLSLGAAVSPLHDRNLAPRKVDATFMTFPVPRCSSAGKVERHINGRCERLEPRVRALVVREVLDGCRTFGFSTPTCSGLRTVLREDRCYNVTSYASTRTLCNQLG
ncbi:uncharacterized protein B0H64DRAFT_248175 [Chaetomium fimeti]|uniref:Uncharacterized protein n=1 Tax=Chaetomium fimeti TaxID=1854472 RepID=A0AAE0LNN2_9PEZI|nr:hypothetical protein B0H64DRAFT_248175 [Chaetomium fimeti]